MTYFGELCKAMSLLAEQSNSIFIGQAIKYPGTAMYNSLSHLPEEKRLELPVTEDMQMGMATGLSLTGCLPICIYPRINFLLLATTQLVLHLDKLPIYGSGYKPKVVIRTAVATTNPLDPGPQHIGDYCFGLQMMLSNVLVIPLEKTEHILPIYQKALETNDSTILVEFMDMYTKD